jgi:hypothetical protein
MAKHPPMASQLPGHSPSLEKVGERRKRDWVGEPCQCSRVTQCVRVSFFLSLSPTIHRSILFIVVHKNTPSSFSYI